MSARDDMPDDRKELYRRGVAFLKGARDLPELTAAHMDHIERRLARSAAAVAGRRPLLARRLILAPLLAALAIVLVTGAALAVAGRDPSMVPVVGRLLRAISEPAGAIRWRFARRIAPGVAARAGAASRIGSGVGAGVGSGVRADADQPDRRGREARPRVDRVSRRPTTGGGACGTARACAPGTGREQRRARAGDAACIRGRRRSGSRPPAGHHAA